MNSLQELNNWGTTEVDYLDARPSGVVFNRQYPLGPVDQTFDAYAGLEVSPTPGIEIVDIINYQTANVRYRVTIKTGSSPLFTGSTITFGTLPSGATLSQVGDVYTISGIHKVSDWDAVKNFTWTLPVSFASYPQWYLECTIIYYSSTLAEDVETTWEIYDDRFYNVAALTAESSITAYIGVNSPTAAALSSTATVYANPWNQVYGAAAIASEATFVCEGNLNVDFLNAVSTMTVQGKLDAVGTASMSASATQSANGLAIAVNLDERTYLANQGNQIFATNTPQVDTLTPATDTISIALSSALGQFAANSTDAPVSTLTISGTKAAVNSALINVHFYPTKGSSASGTFTWQQSLNSVVQFTKTITMTGFANNFAETVLTFTSNDTWTPTRSQVYYGFADALIVGGGGGGAYGGGGGGGGVRYITNQSLSLTGYSIVVGAGGTAGSDANPGSPYSLNGGAGGNSSALSYTANGGTGGKNTTTIVSSVVYHDISGGASGSPTSYAGGARSGVRTAPFNIGGGGGGAGAVGQAPDLSLPGYYGGNGGNGVANSITGTSTYYGGGGGGYISQYTGSTILSGIGGLGGGGDGYNVPSQNIISDGTNGLGGGGGGGSQNESTSIFKIGKGGSGVVIIKIHA